jgi:hypothetical protein
MPRRSIRSHASAIFLCDPPARREQLSLHTPAMLSDMGNALEWIAAIGAVLATVGTWFGPARARWELRAEELRTGRAQRENELHRRRFASVWEWQRDHPPVGPVRVAASRWYSEWTGAARPRRGGLDSGPMTPGQHSGDVDDAYDRYIDFLDAIYQPGRQAPPIPPLQEDDFPSATRRELPVSGGADEASR